MTERSVWSSNSGPPDADPTLRSVALVVKSEAKVRQPVTGEVRKRRREVEPLIHGIRSRAGFRVPGIEARAVVLPKRRRRTGRPIAGPVREIDVRVTARIERRERDSERRPRHGQGGDLLVFTGAVLRVDRRVADPKVAEHKLSPIVAVEIGDTCARVVHLDDSRKQIDGFESRACDVSIRAQARSRIAPGKDQVRPAVAIEIGRRDTPGDHRDLECRRVVKPGLVTEAMGVRKAKGFARLARENRSGCIVAHR